MAALTAACAAAPAQVGRQQAWVRGARGGVGCAVGRYYYCTGRCSPPSEKPASLIAAAVAVPVASSCRSSAARSTG